MQNLADFLHRDKIVDRYVARSQINRHFGDVNGPGKGGVCLAAILFVIPEHIARRFVTRPGAESPVRRNVALACCPKFLRSIGIVQRATRHQRLFDSQCGGLY